MTISRLEKPVFQTQTIHSSDSKSLRVLFLAPFAPNLQASHGGSRVIAQLMAHLVQRHSIGLCYLRAAREPAVDRLLMEQCEIVEEVVIPDSGAPGTNRWTRRLRVWKDLIMGKPLWAIDRFSPAYGGRVKRILKVWQPDIVQLEFHIMGQYLSALADHPAPRILVEHEPGEAAARELLNSSFAAGRIMPLFDLFAWKRFERNVIRQVQAVVAFTERDCQTVRRLGQQTPIVQIPLGTDVFESSSQTTESKSLSLLFVGNYKHMPNLDAASRLINEIFPRVQAQFPEARLFVVGDHLPSRFFSQANENVVLTGYVPDIKPYLDEATLVVAPLRLGGGMRVKVLDALAAGKPLVASSRAVEGLELVNGLQMVLAEDDDEFIQAILDLLGHPQKRTFLATQARAWSSENLSWERTAEAYEALYRNLLKC